MALGTWFAETRPQFLLLSVTLVLVGSAAAAADGPFSPLLFALTLAGLVLLHAGCNVFNDWFDYRSGIDLETKRPPFSGGSGFLPGGAMTPRAAFVLGALALAGGCAAGIALTALTSPWLLAIGFAGVFLAVAYNPLLSKIMLGEIAAGAGLGFLPVIVTYFAVKMPSMLDMTLLLNGKHDVAIIIAECILTAK
mgnify:CR=1 FL=1